MRINNTKYKKFIQTSKVCISFVFPTSDAIFLGGGNQRYKYFAWCTLLVYLDVSRNTTKL